MSEITFNGGEQRLLAFKKLKTFITNPGMFALTVLGSRGTGKHFAIKKAFEEVKESLSKNQMDELCLTQIKFITAQDIPRLSDPIINGVNKMDAFLVKYTLQTVVLEDIEELEREQEINLFNALSTENGKFGIDTKHASVRFIFTSSKPVDELRSNENQISNILWDRISQLVVELPSFKVESSRIYSDFVATWNKMSYTKLKEFNGLDSCPQSERMKYFIENNADKFEGGFRDLDKIAILYFNYRIFHYGDLRKINDTIEEKVYHDMKNDFFGRSQLKEESKGSENLFDFDNNYDSLDEINSAFKVQLRKWALSKHPTLGSAAKALKCSIHTLKNYREGIFSKKDKSNKNKKVKGKKAKL